MNNVNEMDFEIFASAGVRLNEKLGEMDSFVRIEAVSSVTQTVTGNVVKYNDVKELNLVYEEAEISDTTIGVNIYVDDSYIGYMKDASEGVVLFHCLRNFMECDWDEEKFIQNAHKFSYGYKMDYNVVDEVALAKTILQVLVVTNTWNRKGSENHEQYLETVTNLVLGERYDSSNEKSELSDKEKISSIFLYLDEVVSESGEVKNPIEVVKQIEEIIYQ